LAGSKNSLMDKTRVAAAFREAGHAVMAWDRGIGLEAITVGSNRLKYRRNAWNNPLEALDPDWIRSKQPEKLIGLLALISLAGPVAVHRFDPADGGDPILRERLDNADKLLGILSESNGSQRVRRRRLETEASRLFKEPAIWAKTERLAMNLLKQGSLTGIQATRILEE
jgi:hypothetical protein